MVQEEEEEMDMMTKKMQIEGRVFTIGFILDPLPYVWLSLMIDGTESRGENRQVNCSFGFIVLGT